MAINTAPRDSVGYFCAGTRRELRAVLSAALSGRLPVTSFERMQVILDEQVLSSRVLNDALFAHEGPASTSRYTLRVGRVSEEQNAQRLALGKAFDGLLEQIAAGASVNEARKGLVELLSGQSGTQVGAEPVGDERARGDATATEPAGG